MNIMLILGIARTALAIAAAHTEGDDDKIAKTGQQLLSLISAARQAYEEHEGKPIDPSLITEHEHLI